jgi:hypothetical protein
LKFLNKITKLFNIKFSLRTYQNFPYNVMSNTKTQASCGISTIIPFANAHPHGGLKLNMKMLPAFSSFNISLLLGARVRKRRCSKWMKESQAACCNSRSTLCRVHREREWDSTRSSSSYIIYCYITQTHLQLLHFIAFTSSRRIYKSIPA